MKKSFKWAIGITSGFFLLIIIFTLSLPFFINPNDYKDKLLGIVEKKTGRRVEMKGDIDLSLTMGLDVAFQLGQISISSTSPFADTTLAESKKVEIEMGLLPLLLKKELNISKIILKDIHLNLIKNKDGINNWQVASKKKTSSSPQEKTQKPSKEKKAKEIATQKKTVKLPRVNLAGIQAENISVEYNDLKNSQTIQVSDFTVTSGHIKDQEAFPCKLSFHINLKDAKGNTHSADIGINSNFTLNSKSQQFFINTLQLDGLISSDKISKTAQPVKIALDGNINLESNRANLKKLNLNFDDISLTGKAEVDNIKKPVYDLDLHLNSIDIDRYRKEKEKDQKAPFLLPVALLKSLPFKLNLSIDQLKLFGIHFSDIVIKADDNKKRLHLSELSAKLYDGTVKMQGALDLAGDKPKITLTEQLDQVQVEPLLKAIKDTDDISGIAKVNAEIVSTGTTDQELIRNMNGDLSIELQNGLIKSLKIVRVIRIAKSIYLKEAISGESSDQPTGFAKLTATGKIKKGVFHNYDLQAFSDLMKVAGEGTADLAAKTVDYKLNIYLASRLKRDLAQGKVVYDEAPIIYTVKGPFSDLEQDADVTKVLASEGKNLLMKEVQKQMEGNSGGSLLEKGLQLFGK